MGIPLSFVELFFKKTSSAVTAKDIQKFLKRKLEENLNLDYTSIETFGNFDELAKDVSAFANSDGGLIILGVSEERKEIRGRQSRIYPKEITWGDTSCKREQLENALRSRIDPPVELRIFPVRKSDYDSRVIFLIDIPKSNNLHMHKSKHTFYKRLNFRRTPMNRSDVISFVRERLNYERCAWFRYNLDGYLDSFMHEMLCRLDTKYRKLHDFDLNRRLQHFKRFARNLEQTMTNISQHVKIIEIIRFGDSLSTYHLRRLEEINGYPHAEITPEERLFFDTLKKDMSELNLDSLRTFLIEEAKFHKIDSQNWMQFSAKEFGEAAHHEDHVLNVFEAHVSSALELSRYILKLKIKLNELKQQYGDFETTKPIMEYHRKIGRSEESAS